MSDQPPQPPPPPPGYEPPQGSPARGQSGQPGQPPPGAPPAGRSGQPQPGVAPPAHAQGNQYGQVPSGGYATAPAQPREPLDLAKLVSIAAWVVLGLFTVAYLYALTQDDFGSDFGDRFFSGMPSLAQGIFFSGVLHAVAVWLARQREDA